MTGRSGFQSSPGNPFSRAALRHPLPPLYAEDRGAGTGQFTAIVVASVCVSPGAIVIRSRHAFAVSTQTNFR